MTMKRRTPLTGPLLGIATLMVTLVGACSSQKPAVRTIEKRDYSSANTSSIKFLMDTFREDAEERRMGSKRMWSWGDRRRENAWIQKKSLAFLWEALTVEEWTNTKQAWGTDLGRELMPEVNYWKSARFGFLDSDE